MESYENQLSFERELLRLHTTLGDRRLWFTAEKLQEYIDKVSTLKSTPATGATKKRPGDYGFLNRYDIAEFGGVKKLIRAGDKNEKKVYICLEEIYCAIQDAHIACGHGGEKRTLKELSKTFANVTREQVKLYLSMCERCVFKKLRMNNKGGVVNPARPNASACGRAHMDDFDLQKQPDEEYRYDPWSQSFTMDGPIKRDFDCVQKNFHTSHSEDAQFVNPTDETESGLVGSTAPTVFNTPSAIPVQRMTTQEHLFQRDDVPSTQEQRHRSDLDCSLAFDVPKLRSRRCQTEGPDVTGTCLQVAAYIITTMPEFQSIQFEVRELPSKEPVLHMRRADLYGVLGWPCDPVICTLSLGGLLTFRVMYCPPRKIPTSCVGVVLDVDLFITEMRWLMSLKSVCPGISTDCMQPTETSGPVQIFRYPEPRIQSSKCPVVLDGEGRTCAGCRTKTDYLRKRGCTDSYSSGCHSKPDHSRKTGRDGCGSSVSIPMLPGYLEDQPRPSTGKKPRLSCNLVLSEEMKTTLKNMLAVPKDSVRVVSDEVCDESAANISTRREMQLSSQHKGKVCTFQSKMKKPTKTRIAKTALTLEMSCESIPTEDSEEAHGPLITQTSNHPYPATESKYAYLHSQSSIPYIQSVVSLADDNRSGPQASDVKLVHDSEKRTLAESSSICSYNCTSEPSSHSEIHDTGTHTAAHANPASSDLVLHSQSLQSSTPSALPLSDSQPTSSQLALSSPPEQLTVSQSQNIRANARFLLPVSQFSTGFTCQESNSTQTSNSTRTPNSIPTPVSFSSASEFVLPASVHHSVAIKQDPDDDNSMEVTTERADDDEEEDDSVEAKTSVGNKSVGAGESSDFSHDEGSPSVFSDITLSAGQIIVKQEPGDVALPLLINTHAMFSGR